MKVDFFMVFIDFQIRKHEFGLVDTFSQHNSWAFISQGT